MTLSVLEAEPARPGMQVSCLHPIICAEPALAQSSGNSTFLQVQTTPFPGLQGLPASGLCSSSRCPGQQLRRPTQGGLFSPKLSAP